MTSLDKTNDWVQRFYKHLDAKDTAALTAACTDDVRVRLGSDEAVVGHDAFAKKLAGFFNAHAQLNHEVLSIWQAEDKTFVELTSTHGLPNGRRPSAPSFAVISRNDEGMIYEIKTFLDRTAYSPTAAKAVAEELGYGS